MTNPLLKIRELGQSVWYDNISRELLKSGELKRMIEQDGVVGVTSNPSIFEKAILQDRIYENELHALVDRGLHAQNIFETLVLADIRDAADLFRPVYDETAGLDGYVSLEVSPHLAYDTLDTLVEVRRLHSVVDRENVMIKIPSTGQGIEAARILMAEGININLTLIFSPDQYRAAATAYLEAMERRAAHGEDCRKPASVASVFVSRIDTATDERLREVVDPQLRNSAASLTGKVAVAGARITYSIFKEMFHGERFDALKEKGARPQRIVWASTSTKNPSYSDTLYVDQLIGADTVNTIPTTTLEAFRDHGKPEARLEQGLDEARSVFQTLEELQIGMDDVTEQLLENGVKAFTDSLDGLIDQIQKKRIRLIRGWGHQAASLGDLQKNVDETLANLDKEKVAESIWGGDASIWSNDPQVRSKITCRLGWLSVAETMLGERRRLTAFSEEMRSLGFNCAVLLGMGGSSLASEVFVSSLGVKEGYLDLKVLDTTLPGAILDVHRTLDLDRTLFLVSSKSGGTIEVMSLYRYFRSVMEQHEGEWAGGHFVAITDPGTSLGKLASEHGFRKVFLNPADVGGRFSALSYFGLVPAALIGADLDYLLLRADQAAEASGPAVPSLESPGSWLGTIMAEAALAGKDKLTLIMSPGMATFGYWIEQLVAESTGKNGQGILPIDGESVGEPATYGSDRLFVYLRLDGEGAYDEKVSALEKAGQPVVTLRLHGPYDLGREMFRWEFATAVAGVLMNINPFDEPNVQESKDITNSLLEAFKRDGKLPDGERVDVNDPSLITKLGAFCAGLQPGDYMAVNAFIRLSKENRDALNEIRNIVRDRFGVATAAGFGPRYLHSTGQIHKGGAPKGHFLMITTEHQEDAPVPGESYSFGVLNSAQSMGDYEAIKKRNRPILRVHLGSESDLGRLLEAVKSLA